MLDDEELPELSLSEPDSNSKNNDPTSSERSSSCRQNVGVCKHGFHLIILYAYE
jgi:hypothetical protein